MRKLPTKRPAMFRFRPIGKLLDSWCSMLHSRIWNERNVKVIVTNLVHEKLEAIGKE